MVLHHKNFTFSTTDEAKTLNSNNVDLLGEIVGIPFVLSLSKY